MAAHIFYMNNWLPVAADDEWLDMTELINGEHQNRNVGGVQSGDENWMEEILGKVELIYFDDIAFNWIITQMCVPCSLTTFQFW